MCPFDIRSLQRWAVASIVAVSPSLASALADEPLPPMRPASYDWQGPYAGVLLGLKSFRTSHADLSGAPADFSATGRIAGIIAGYNFTHRDLVFGPEGDVSYGLLKATENGSAFKTDFHASLRARVGRRFGRALPFATAGISTVQFVYRDAQPGIRQSHVQFNATAGGGIEFALAPALSGRIEYLYGRKLGSRATGLDHTHIVRAAATYQFGK